MDDGRSLTGATEVKQPPRVTDVYHFSIIGLHEITGQYTLTIGKI
jgi:hypothetical protein